MKLNILIICVQSLDSQSPEYLQTQVTECIHSAILETETENCKIVNLENPKKARETLVPRIVRLF